MTSLRILLLAALWMALTARALADSPKAQHEGLRPLEPEGMTAARALGRTLDGMAEAADEFGSIHISPPLLTSPDEGFHFDLDRSAQTYFEEAKTEISSDTAAFEQVVQGLAAGLSAQADAAQMMGGLEGVTEYFSAKARRDRKRLLLDESIEQQFQADLLRALALTNAVERVDAIAKARKTHAEAFPAPDNLPTFPAGSESGLPGRATGVAQQPTDARAVLSEGKFRDFQKLFPDAAPAPRINNRAALNKAAGDVATEAIFRLLGNPAGAQSFTGRRVAFGVVEVTVNPGWRTRQGYAADITMLTEYAYGGARTEVLERVLREPSIPLPVRVKVADDAGLPRADFGQPAPPEDELRKARALRSEELLRMIPAKMRKADASGDLHRPTIFAISPFSDIEVSNQASSLRRRDELALNLGLVLRYFGAKAEAEVLEQFVRDQQRDARSRSATAAITAYSQGSAVGFQVGPRFQAISDPADHKPRSGNVLGRQSFPSLLLFGFNPEDLYPKIAEGNGSPWQLVEPQLRLTQVPSWRRMDRPGFFSPSPRFDEVRKLEMSIRHNQAKDTHREGLDPWNLGATFVAREKAIKFQVFGGQSTMVILSPGELVPLPQPKVSDPPVIVATVPGHIVLASAGERHSVVILGSGLDQIVPEQIRELAGNAAVAVKHASADALLLEITLQKAVPLVLTLPVAPEPRWPRGMLFHSQPILVTDAGSPPPRPVLRTRTSKGSPAQTDERTIEISPGLTGEELEAAQQTLQSVAPRRK